MSGNVSPYDGAAITAQPTDWDYELGQKKSVAGAAVGGIEGKDKNTGIFNGNEWLHQNPEGLTDNLNEQCETPQQGEPLHTVDTAPPALLGL
jgi:hypothetical protein